MLEKITSPWHAGQISILHLENFVQAVNAVISFVYLSKVNIIKRDIKNSFSSDKNQKFLAMLFILILWIHNERKNI